LQGLPDKILNRAVGRGVNRGAAVVVKSAKSKAPIGSYTNGRVGGVLRRNITKKKLRNRANRITYIVGVEAGKITTSTQDAKKVVVRTRGRIKLRSKTRREKVGEDPFYYRWVEEGFRAVGRRKGGSGQFIDGQHFLHDALANNEDAVVREFKKGIEIVIDKINAGQS
jgi:hypothetical protein